MVSWLEIYPFLKYEKNHRLFAYDSEYIKRRILIFINRRAIRSCY